GAPSTTCDHRLSRMAQILHRAPCCEYGRKRRNRPDSQQSALQPLEEDSLPIDSATVERTCNILSNRKYYSDLSSENRRLRSTIRILRRVPVQSGRRVLPSESGSVYRNSLA